MEHLFFKKAGIGIAAFFLIAAVFLFRDTISGLFSFGPDFSPVKSGNILFSDQAKNSEKNKPNISSETALPKYTGRDPQEVRPHSEEVKLFSEEQKEKLYSDIRMHGSAVKEKPDYLFGWIQVGLLKKIIGDYDGARDAWEYAGKIRPENSVSFANLGELYWRYLPDFTKSEINFKISIKNKPDDPATYMSLSDLYSYSYAGKKDLADDILLEGIVANPDSTDLMKYLANLYEREKEYVLALEWWQKALVKDPTNSEIAATIEALKKKITP